MNHYFDNFYFRLFRNGINKSNICKKIFSWNDTKILNFLTDAFYDLYTDEMRQSSFYTFSANTSLSGGPFPCSSAKCRLENLETLVRFAILYADKVYIDNPFEKYFLLDEKCTDALRLSIIGDIEGLLYLYPFIQKGLVSIQNNVHLLCHQCYEKELLVEQEKKKEFISFSKELEEELLREAKVFFYNDVEESYFEFIGPEEIINHGSLIVTGDLARKFSSKKSKKFKNELSLEQISQYHLLDFIIDPIIDDLLKQSIRVGTYKTQFLTDNVIQFNYCTKNFKTKKAEMANEIVTELSHSIPVLSDIPTVQLLKIRERDGELFEVYRDKLHSTLDQSKKLPPSEAEELFDNEIMPEIHKIDLLMKNNKKRITKDLIDDVLIGSGYLTIALINGSFLPTFTGIVSAIGGISCATTIIKKVLTIKSVPETVEEKPYFFLWKISKEKIINK